MAGFRRNWLASDDHNLVLHLEPYQETKYMIRSNSSRNISERVWAAGRGRFLASVQKLLESPWVNFTRGGLGLVTAAVRSPPSDCDLAKLVLLE